MGERVLVIQIQQPRRRLLPVRLAARRDHEGDRVVEHELGGATQAHFAGHDAAWAEEDRDLPQGRLDHRGGTRSSRRRHRFQRLQVVPHGVQLCATRTTTTSSGGVLHAGGQVHVRGSLAGLCDGTHEQRRAHHPLVVHREGVWILGKLHEQRPHHGHTCGVRLVENSVPHGKQRIPQHGCTAENTCVWIAKYPRFPALCVQMCVAAEERSEGTGLVPAREELCVRVPEESAHICAGER
mmetsp:Transcript_13197/g.21961  ORF Transcript_13197/g.21961 Transcript_13197/m.21961 type:complete len:239 (+) Transcript_13197:344-1060(+)